MYTAINVRHKIAKQEEDVAGGNNKKSLSRKRKGTNRKTIFLINYTQSIIIFSAERIITVGAGHHPGIVIA